MDNGSQSKGFSLIELMVVIAIVTVLSAISIPAYESYIKRGKAREVSSVAETPMKDWLLSDQTSKPYPAATGAVGKYVQSIVVDGTGVALQLNNPSTIDPILDGATVKYTPTTTAENVIKWTCVVTILGGGGTYTTTTTSNPTGAWGGWSSSYWLYSHVTNHHTHSGGGAANADATKLICG